MIQVGVSVAYSSRESEHVSPNEPIESTHDVNDVATSAVDTGQNASSETIGDA